MAGSSGFRICETAPIEPGLAIVHKKTQPERFLPSDEGWLDASSSPDTLISTEKNHVEDMFQQRMIASVTAAFTGYRLPGREVRENTFPKV